MNNVDGIFRGFGWSLIGLGVLSALGAIDHFYDYMQSKSNATTGIDVIVLAAASPILAAAGGWMVGRNQK